MEAQVKPGVGTLLAAFCVSLVALLLIAPAARAGVDGQCPAIADKPDSVPHVDYTGVQHKTYCYGPITIKPGQNTIKYRNAIDGNGTKLWPQQPGYITRFDPELILADGSVPPVDVLHLHHAVWVVDGNPQFAVGEEKTIQQLPTGFGWRSQPSDGWLLNDMLHDLVAKPAQVYVVWRVDFVPDTSPDAPSIKTVQTKWLDVAGNPSFYPVFDTLRGRGSGGTYTFPDQAPAEDTKPCGFSGRDKGAHGCLGAAQSWTPNQDVTLIQTAGHLHPGGLNTQLRDTRAGNTNTLFTSEATYYEPAGAVSWDVAMRATPNTWRVKVPAGDKLTVHTTYDTNRADWYEVMGIMPTAVYFGNDVGGVDAQDPAADAPTPVLTHTHLAENDNHGGAPTSAPDRLSLPSAPAPNSTIGIQSFTYQAIPGGQVVPTVEPGKSLTFRNLDATPSVNAFHTITGCANPCTQTTGVAFPVADGPVSFDSGELGFNGNDGGLPVEPAADRDTWTTPKDLPAGTYSYFCRVHPFMRGAFRVEQQSNLVHKLKAKKKQTFAKAAVTETLGRAGTVTLQAKLKPSKGAADSRALSKALDTKRSKTSLAANVKKKIKLRFSKAARKMIRAASGQKRWKVIVTATATDGYGKSSTAKAGFTLTG